MLRPLLLHAALGLLVAGSATAQVYSGVFAAPNDQGGQTVVTLQQAGQRVTGTIVGPGARFQLEGVLEDGSVVGAVTGAPGGGLWFEAELDGSDLYLTLVGAGADGKPDYGQATTLTFARQGDAAPVASDGVNPLAGSANPLGAAADPWIGAFTDGTLTLLLQGGAGRYTGTVRLGGQEFPATLEGTGATLSGSFQSSDGTFPLTLERRDGAVALQTGGATYVLRRADGAANPLAGGGMTAGVAPSPNAAAGVAGTLDDGTPLGREWSQFLAGKKATKMSSYSSGSAGGYSSRSDVHLCPNGQFAMRGSDLVTVDVGDAGGYSGGNSAGQGTWRIITQGDVAGIELRYGGGQVEQYRLDYQDNKTYVNGERWLVTPSEACGGGY